MKNLIETIKANKNVIIRRTLVVTGVAVGIAVVSVFVSKIEPDAINLEVVEIPDTEL